MGLGIYIKRRALPCPSLWNNTYNVMRVSWQNLNRSVWRKTRNGWRQSLWCGAPGSVNRHRLIDVAWADSGGTVTKSQRGGAVLIKTLGLSHDFWLRFSLSLVREQYTFKLGSREFLDVLEGGEGLFVLINLTTKSAGIGERQASSASFPVQSV